ncbi:MAG: NAD(P)-binding domain-containing protein, partial [Candidatus Methylopumilus sp.]|nr:NAD(P)-binding domain-containing protein [Candidatus Methylopumilus sp.]
MTSQTVGKICFIGGGNMARALIGGLKNNGYLMNDINVIEPEAEKRAQLQADFGVNVTEQLP